MALNSIAILIPGELPGMNEYITEMNRHRIKGNDMKKVNTQLVAYYAIKARGHKLKAPFFIEFHWYCKNKKKDKDNIAFAKKFILDGFQVAGVIPQDTWNAIEGFRDLFFIDAKKPRIEVIIRQANQNVCQ